MSSLSWKHVVKQAEHLFGGTSSAFRLDTIGKVETNAVLALIKKLSVQSNHPLINTFRAYIDESAFRDVLPSYIRKMSATKPAPTKLPEYLLIPMVGQSLPASDQNVAYSESTVLNQQKKISTIFTTVNFAIALHRSILEVSHPFADGSLNSNSNPPNNVKCESNVDICAGNKLAILAGDILMASASLLLASLHQPKIVALMSAAIAKAVEAEFSDFLNTLDVTNHSQSFSPLPTAQMTSTDLLAKWLFHIDLRHGSMLGASCESAVMLQSAQFFDSHLSDAAKRFGSAWACISRLIDEYEVVSRNFSKVKMGSGKSLGPLSFGFISGGLSEPTLADYIAVSPSLITSLPSVFTLYTEAAGKLSLDLRNALSALLSASAYMTPVGSLISDSMSLLLRHDVFPKQYN